MNRALGLIEVVGLTNAIIVADTMLKASNIKMEDVEITKGMGFVTVKVSGDVGAVKAAIDSGKSLAVSFNKFVSSKVIPRPAKSLDGFFHLDKEDKLEVNAKDEVKTLSKEKVIEVEDKNKVENEKKEEKVEKGSEIKNNLREKEVKIAETVKVESKEIKKTQSKKAQKDSKNLKTSE